MHVLLLDVAKIVMLLLCLADFSDEVLYLVLVLDDPVSLVKLHLLEFEARVSAQICLLVSCPKTILIDFCTDYTNYFRLNYPNLLRFRIDSIVN